MKRLSGWDASFLYAETPNLHAHTLKIAIVDPTDFDGEFTFDYFRAVFAQLLPQLEPLRYQLVEIPLKFHHAMWQENCDVDHNYHLRRVCVPSPGGRRELDRLVGEIVSAQLDRRRPLWELYFAEGLADGRIALITKVHHSLADGVASANLVARATLSATPPGIAQSDTSPPPSSGELLRLAARDHIRQIKQLPALLRDTASGMRKLRRRTKARGTHPDLATSPPPTFFNHMVTPEWRFASASVAFADAKEASKQLGITLNDLVLAMAAGALRSALLRVEGSADKPLIAAVPVGTDNRPDRISGNALGGRLVSLPVHVDDALKRVRLVTMASQIAKENNQLVGPELIGRWTEYLPPVLSSAACRWISRREIKNPQYNLSISNVPGPRARGRVGGVLISEFLSAAPLTIGACMNLTVWSYADQLNTCVVTDARTMDDPHRITDAVVHELAVIRLEAGLSGDLTPVDTAISQVPTAN